MEEKPVCVMDVISQVPQATCGHLPKSCELLSVFLAAPKDIGVSINHGLLLGSPYNKSPVVFLGAILGPLVFPYGSDVRTVTWAHDVLTKSTIPVSILNVAPTILDIDGSIGAGRIWRGAEPLCRYRNALAKQALL